MPATWTAEDHLEVLRNLLKATVPYTCGVHPVRAEDLGVFYISGNGEPTDSARYVDFCAAGDAQLVDLAASCQQATFGVDQKDVLDETYRKAGKLDTQKFATRFDVAASGLLDAISPDLLDGQKADDGKVIRAEMYKLNVYGPGSFFKAHKDTPRGDNMIGSLVVVLPTAHEGGVLTLSHGDHSYAFDAAAELTAHGGGSTPGSAVAYSAFFSDVVHTVEEVRAGFRVTITYNLFLVDRPFRAAALTLGRRIAPAAERACETALRALLADVAFLPAGGFLAFGLTHQYPMRRRRKELKPLSHPPVLQVLKGSDARIRTVAERIGLPTLVKFVYETTEYDVQPAYEVLLDHILDLDYYYDEDGDMCAELDKQGVLVDRPATGAETDTVGDDDWWRARQKARNDKRHNAKKAAVHWATDRTELNPVETEYLGYGNEHSIDHVYGHAALFVRIAAVVDGVRSTY
ncbi:hypothetical protein GGX14DRAFT_407921 [Mycena pura]|uniref:Prolyl 4-hydroxylase alpha subunit Fe(2+) 2OG dioxygenase domain-containing protein n=1 Tax=Mycena pura TaxID=153505 RepID=A0AAD6UM72_9AGAR|nr:hypothetical protein GGX14DRAFT_407921 [Mycena pura]